jgi:flagellar basal-body rod modification protein FlgD
MQIMAVPTAAQTASGTTNTPAIDGSNDMFMQLLIAQLQTQDPLSPMDPNQMVDQLVQLNTLNEVTSIRQLLQQLSPSTEATKTGNTQGGS